MEALRDVDVVVIGAGILGLSVTYALQRSGADVVCLEANAPGGAQSSGETRIFRHAYAQAETVDLAARARGVWDSWSREWGTTLIEPTGSLLVSPDLAFETRILESSGVPFEVLDADAEQRLIPWRSARAGQPALLEATAGTILAAKTVKRLVTQVGKAWQRATVFDLQSEVDGRTLVRTRDALLRAETVVVCAGVATPRLAATVGIDVPLAEHPHTRAVFRVRDESLDAMAVPSFRDKTAHPLGAIYTYGIPLTSEEVAVGIEPADNAGTFDALEVAQRTVDYVAAELPGLDPEPVRLESCDSTALDTTGTAPWESEGLVLLRQGGVLAFAGGHYFKFAPLLGELIAGAALGGDVPGILDPRGRATPVKGAG